jgi:hypothetical protein
MYPVMSCVRVNSFKTEWFDVKCGLRQGCILSPLLFNLFINDLTLFIKSFDLGINVGTEKLCIMLYADDIVILADNAQDLQILLNALNEWCSLNDMTVNPIKSKVIHFHPKAFQRTSVVFKCGDNVLNIVDRYIVYLFRCPRLFNNC